MKEILFTIWLAFTFINILYSIVISIVAFKDFMKSHPGRKIKKKAPAEVVLAIFKIIIISVLPIVHIVFGCMYVFCYNYIIEKTVDSLENQSDF